MSKLKVENIEKTFTDGKNTVRALEDISFTIEQGEFVVIVGPSGCGKTTLLNIIGGLDTASSGTIEVDGKPVTKPGGDRGMVFQGYSLFPWLSVIKNVEFGLRMRGIPKSEREETARKYIKLVGLEEFENAMPDTLSGGMKQRVAIARTLANNPALLLMDEPFGALDAQTRIAMQEFLSDVTKSTGSTVLFITHDVDEAILLGSRIIVMSSRPGKILEIIPVELSVPRNHNALTDEGFLSIKKRIMELLWSEN